MKPTPLPAEDWKELKEIMLSLGYEDAVQPVKDWLSRKRTEWMEEIKHKSYEKGYQDATKRYNDMQGAVIKIRQEEARRKGYEEGARKQALMDAEAIQEARKEERKWIRTNIGNLRQWLNEKPNSRLVENKDIELWLELEEKKT